MRSAQLALLGATTARKTPNRFGTFISPFETRTLGQVRASLDTIVTSLKKSIKKQLATPTGGSRSLQAG